MNALSRRGLLGAASLTVPALLLAACAGQTTAQIAAQVTADVDTLANALNAELPAFQAVTGISTAQVAQITTLVQQIVAAAAAFAVTLNQQAGQPIVQQISGAFTALQKALGGFTLPAGVQTVLTAAAVLLPVIEAGVGLFVAAAPAAGMTVAQARKALLAVR